MLRSAPSPQPKHARRSGSALVEFALVLPVLMIILTGTIESCMMIYLRQTLHIAAYEATRVALVPQSTTAQVEYAATQILSDRRVRDSKITITPTKFSTAAISSLIAVTVEAPAGSNFAVPLMFFRNTTLRGTCTMMKEY